MIYTYSISTAPFVVTIEEGGHAIVTQPHHPDAEGLKPWPTKKEAEAWAQAYVAELEEGYQDRLLEAEKLPDPVVDDEESEEVIEDNQNAPVEE
jgi:hypothetical protein